MPFNPTGAKEIPVEGPDNPEEPDLKRLQPEGAFQGREGIPLESYMPFARIPYVSSDEDGIQAGVFVMGADRWERTPILQTSCTASPRAGPDTTSI